MKSNFGLNSLARPRTLSAHSSTFEQSGLFSLLRMTSDLPLALSVVTRSSFFSKTVSDAESPQGTRIDLFNRTPWKLRISSLHRHHPPATKAQFTTSQTVIFKTFFHSLAHPHGPPPAERAESDYSSTTSNFDVLNPPGFDWNLFQRDDANVELPYYKRSVANIARSLYTRSEANSLDSVLSVRKQPSQSLFQW